MKINCAYPVLAVLVVGLLVAFNTLCDNLDDKAESFKTRKVVLETKIGSLECEINKLKVVNAILIQRAISRRTNKVKVTAYHPASKGINSDSDPSMTATITPHKAGRTCAISTELVEDGWLGQEIYIQGYGMFIANDRLAVGMKGKQIDLCMGTYEQALDIGENYGILAILVDRNFINKLMED